jgi:hypothetical protein
VELDCAFGMAAPRVPPFDALPPFRVRGDFPLDVGFEFERKVGVGYELEYSNGAYAAY